MALEPAGISLQADNFNKYIRQLSQIDKAQQSIFNVNDKGLRSAFSSAEKGASGFSDALQKGAKKGSDGLKSLGGAARTAATVGIAATAALAASIAAVGVAAGVAFAKVAIEGVKLNQQFELTEKVFSNVFGDPQLGKATVDFLNETADRLRIARGEAASFAQTILPKTGGLDEFTELLRLTDIQADTTGQNLSDLEFSIREALSGDFVSLKDRFDLGTEQINRIKELTPELGRSQALITVITEEFTRLGKTDISGTLGTNIKDIRSSFGGLTADVGKPIFEVVKQSSEDFLSILNENQPALRQTATSLGEIGAEATEFVTSGITDFLEGINFDNILGFTDALSNALNSAELLLDVLFDVPDVNDDIQDASNSVDNFAKGLRRVAEVVAVVKARIAEASATAQNLGTIVQVALGKISPQEAFAKFQEPQDAFRESILKSNEAFQSFDERAKENEQRIRDRNKAVVDGSAADREAINAKLAAGAAEEQATRAAAERTEQIGKLANVLKQAEALQLSFSRSAEDTARQRARQEEDIARKQAQSVAKLEERQAKDRDGLLKDQAKQLDKFEKDRRKQIAGAEKEIRDARKEAGEQRKRDQQKLQRELQQAQERFNLSQLQSERRFSVQEKRLRAEGDILALQQLREDRDLERQEEKENFELGKKEQISSAQEQQKEQAKDLENRIKELKSGLEDQRAELLASFDEQLQAQREAQILAKAEQQRAFEEQAAERAIQLQREEEDKRISQQRQLEDLGRSFAEQEGITEAGTTAIANQLEKVFGIDGSADTIISGFTSKTKNEFTTLFEDLEKIVSEAEIDPPTTPIPVRRTTSSGGGFGGRLGGVSEFQDGGVVPGPIGVPQPAIVHGGETILPTHQRSFQMTAPIIPSQTLNVAMSGGFNISGDGQANEQILQAAAVEMTENFRIAVQRLARRN